MTAVSPIATGLARFEDRGPCTDAERRAAAWLHDELRAAGHEAWVETHWVRPQWALSIALHAALGVAAALLGVRAAAGAIAAAVAAVSMAVEASGRRGAAAAGCSRAARPRTSSRPRRRAAGVTLLIARATTRRAAADHSDGPRRLAARLRRRLGGHALGPRAGSRWRWRRSRRAQDCGSSTSTGCGSGSRSSCRRSGCWLRWPRRATSRSPPSPRRRATTGPGRRRAGPARRAHPQPAGALTPALLLFGAGEGGPAAVRAHLRRERLDRARVVVLELGPCGAGAPAYATGHPQLRAACERAAGALAARRARRATLDRGRRGPRAAAAGGLDRGARRGRHRPALAPARGHGRAARPVRGGGRARLRARLRRRARRRAPAALMQPRCISAWDR